MKKKHAEEKLLCVTFGFLTSALTDLLCLKETCPWRVVEQVEAISSCSCRGLISALSYASVIWSTKTRGWSWWITPHTHTHTLTERNLALHIKTTCGKQNYHPEKPTSCSSLKPTSITPAAAPSWVCCVLTHEDALLLQARPGASHLLTTHDVMNQFNKWPPAISLPHV